MDIYNLNDFKCCLCSKWFHPKNALPFMLTCTHSLCGQCLTTQQQNRLHKQYIDCPKHLTRQYLTNLKLNEHILQALQRLLKNNKDQSYDAQLKHQTLLLNNLINSHKQDSNDFAQLLNRIYSNQIKRLEQLRRRVRQQIKDPIAWVTHWQELTQNCKDQREAMDQGRQLENSIKQFYEIQLQKIAQQVIANPSLCLKRHFSIYDLVEKEEHLPRKTLKSSTNPNHRQNRKNSFNQKYINKQGQENISINFIKHVESPQFRQELKQLNSFKLQTSRLADTTEDIGETTHRDCQRSKCSLKTKVAVVEKDNIKINENIKMNFVDLIYSLKCSEEGDALQYSPEPVLDEMLLSEAKEEKVNFLKQWQIPKPKPKHEMEIRRKEFICSEKEKNKYIKRMETVRTAEARAATSLTNGTLQLFNFDLKEVDLPQYLDQFDWQKVEVIKLVATGLQDVHFNQLLNYLINTKVHTLLLPSNELEQISLDALIYFSEMNSNLRTVSLQKNNIQTLSSKTRSKIALLKQKGVNLYI